MVIFDALLASYSTNLNTFDYNPPYDRGRLIQEVFNHAAEPLGRDNFLRYFLARLISSSSSRDITPDLPSQAQFRQALSILSNFQQWRSIEQKEIFLSVKNFSDHLVHAFFTPCEYILHFFSLNLDSRLTKCQVRASGGKTPYPLERSSSSTSAPVTGTPTRLATLRQDCLLRDHHRCVVTGAFDEEEFFIRYKKDGNNAKDDDGELLLSDPKLGSESLNVAHIIPHCFVSLNSGETELVCIMVFILNLFLLICV